MESAPSSGSLPTLRKGDNFTLWHVALHSQGLEHDWHEYLTENKQPPVDADDATKAAHNKRKAQALRTLLTYTSQDLLSELEIEVTIDTPPCQLFQAIKSRFQARTDPATQQNLLKEVHTITFDKFDNVSDYIARHRAMRQRMITAKVPGIADETMTVHYIISGIESTKLPDYIGRNLRFQQFKTIEECYQGVETLCRPIAQKSVVSAMHSRGQGFGRDLAINRGGRGKRYRYRDRNRDNTRRDRPKYCHYHKQYDECWKTPYPAEVKKDDQDRPRQRRNRRANAVLLQDDTDQAPPTIVDMDELNNDDSEYILDSGAWPTHLRRPQTHMRPYKNTKYTITANGQTTKLSHYGKATMPSLPKPLTISKAIVAPAFKSNLISVHQVCQTGKTILFNENAAYIIPKQQPPPQEQIIAVANAKNGLYKFRTSTNMKPRANTARQFSFRDWRAISSARARRSETTQELKYPSTDINVGTKLPTKPPLCPPLKGEIIATIDCTARPNFPHETQPSRNAPTSAEDWHLIMNHTNYNKLSKMAHQKLVTGMPSKIQKPRAQITCSGCAIGHQANAPFKGLMPRYAKCDLVTADIGEPSETSNQGFLYFATFTETYTRRKFIFLCKKKSDVRQHTITALNRISTQLGLPIKRFKPDGAKEFSAAEIQEYCNSKGIILEPSTRYTPQENSVSEQFNRTLMERARAAIYTAEMTFRYWDFAILDTVTKYNHTYHDSIRTIPEALWSPERKPNVATFQPFGAYGYTTNINSVPRKLKKNQPRAILTRYLYRPDPLHYYVLDVDRNRIFKCRCANFKAYSPHLDPTRLLTHPSPRAGKATLQKNTLPRSRGAAATTNLNRPKPRAPTTLHEARNYPDSDMWEKAYNAELSSHEKKGTFKWILRRNVPKDANIYPPSISFRYKCDTNGNVIDRKVRISYRGDKTKPYIHYDPHNLATYAPDKDAIRLVLAIGTHLDMDMHHVDISSAYLHEDVDSPTPLYMRRPPPFYGGTATRTIVAQLVKNIYGLKQASRTYANGLRKHLNSLGYNTNRIESQVYILHRGNDFILMPTVTDDFLIASTSSSLLAECKNHLSSKYTIRDLGEAEHFIGWRIERDRKNRTTTISQPALSMQILEDFRMMDCNPAATPYLSGVTLEPIRPDEQPLDSTEHPYCSCVGALRYLADCTRPDLAKIVASLARSLTRPAKRHWNAAKRVLRYLKGTINLGIKYKQGNGGLYIESDADYANCKSTRKSVYANVVFFNDAPISWASRTIKTVCTSTCEAEYIAAGQAAKQARYIRTLLQSFLTHQTQSTPLKSKLFDDPTPLGIDNTAAIRIATASSPTKRSKYIDVQHHFIQDLVRNGTVRPVHVPSKRLTADLLTKPLSEIRFIQLRNQLSMCNDSSQSAAAIGS